MNRFIIVLMLILFSMGIINAQEKYFIFLKDKGISQSEKLNKSSALYKEALNSLNEKAIERRQKVMGSSIITYEDLPVSDSYVEILKEHGMNIHHKLSWFNAVSAYLNAEQIDFVKNLKFVKSIRKVASLKTEKSNLLKFAPNNRQSANENIYEYGNSFIQNVLSDIPEIHNIGFSGQGVTIGLLDTGFDWEEHPAIKNVNVIEEYDFLFRDSITANQDEDVFGQDNHGTAVMSIIAGFNENELIGPAFSANYYLAKTENVASETHQEEDDYAAAMEWLENKGVDITSTSLGYSEFDIGEGSYTYDDMDGNTTIVTQASEMAFQRGVLTICSAGNEGNGIWKYITAPADGFNTIAVGAVNSSNIKTGFSSVGPSSDGRVKPEIVAMGSSIYHARNSKVIFYNFGSGTSFSAPIASGVAAQLLSVYPHLTNKQMRSILIESADNSANPDNETGYGLISALKAVEYPNVKYENDSYIINKMFISDSLSNGNNVSINIENSDSTFTSYPMEFINGNLFIYELGSNVGDSVRFYFSFEKNDIQYSEPTNEPYFTFKKRNLIVEKDVKSNIYEPVPEEYVLFNNYPNPFNELTTIDYYLTENANVKLNVYDILGQKVMSLKNKFENKGYHSVKLNGSNLSSGVYIYNLNVNGRNLTKKMVLLK